MKLKKIINDFSPHLYNQRELFRYPRLVLRQPRHLVVQPNAIEHLMEFLSVNEF